MWCVHKRVLACTCERSRRTSAAASTLAPLSSRSRTTSKWLFSAAIMRPVAPSCAECGRVVGQRAIRGACGV